jgi:hypothetical protein
MSKITLRSFSNGFQRHQAKFWRDNPGIHPHLRTVPKSPEIVARNPFILQAHGRPKRAFHKHLIVESRGEGSGPYVCPSGSSGWLRRDDAGIAWGEVHGPARRTPSGTVRSNQSEDHLSTLVSYLQPYGAEGMGILTTAMMQLAALI